VASGVQAVVGQVLRAAERRKIGAVTVDEKEPGFTALVAELAEFRDVALRGQPSNRTLARAAGVSPTSVGDWLCGERFPQQIDPLLLVVEAIRA
jgi:hypothetical protein